MKPLRRNGLKGNQHLAQGIALGRKKNIIFALNQRSTAEGKVKGQKPYLFHYAFAPAGRSRLRITSTQGGALGWEPTSLSGCIAKHPKHEYSKKWGGADTTYQKMC